jgi:putative transposase
VLKSGCAWRLLPHDFPPWRTVYHYFRAWRLSGIWEKMHAALRERVRVPLKRNPQPSAAIVDSQSVKTTGVGGKERAYDGAKKVKGLKSATCSWTPRDWCSWPRSTGRTSPTATASNSC